jgi:hypothetical protein
MSSSAQLHHASGVLSRVVTLRAALTDPDGQLAKEAAMAKNWRCRVRLHRWQQFRNPEAGWYRECRLCGKYEEGGGSNLAFPN